MKHSQEKKHCLNLSFHIISFMGRMAQYCESYEGRQRERILSNTTTTTEGNKIILDVCVHLRQVRLRIINFLPWGIDMGLVFSSASI